MTSHAQNQRHHVTGEQIMTSMAHVRLTSLRIPEGRPLWLFAGHVGPLVGQAAAGDVVDVLTAAGQFYGRGLYNPSSKIRVRLLTFEDEPIDETFWGGENSAGDSPTTTSRRAVQRLSADLCRR
ncbi:MAG: hypothetical protein HC801_09365 [Nitrospira sp.]|nr:hypothetical protein [Nitrospira sp.]